MLQSMAVFEWMNSPKSVRVFLTHLGLWLVLTSFLSLGQENQFTVEIDGITFDSDYENGSLGAMKLAGPDLFRGELFVESGELGNRSYWFRFKMTGVAGRSIRILLDHSENRRPFIRIGDGSWRRMTAAESSSTLRMTLTFADDEDDAEVAFFEPLGLMETYEIMDSMAEGSPFFSAEVIGQSVLGNDVVMTTVEDLRYPSAEKHRVWVHSRAHAGEVTSTHSMLGFLEQTLEDSELGRRLREHCTFHIVPILNVDGVQLGHTRWDSRGLDPERPWCAIDIPVVQAVKNVVDGFMTSESPIEMALNLHSTRGTYTDTFFFKHLAPSVTPAFEEIQQRYIDAFAAATPLFGNLNPQSSQLNACVFIESYFWNNWGEAVMALTHEGHYGRRITDRAYLTGSDYRELGRAMAVALVEYFGLPAGTEADLDYETWATKNFTAEALSDPGISGRSADPDADGVPNGEEFLVQADPWAVERGVRPLQIQRGQVVVTQAAMASVTQFEIEQSTDLRSWIPLDGSTGVSTETRVVQGVESRVSMLTPRVAGAQQYRIRFQ